MVWSSGFDLDNAWAVASGLSGFALEESGAANTVSDAPAFLVDGSARFGLVGFGTAKAFSDVPALFVF